jgi:hypothetical protein
VQFCVSIQAILPLYEKGIMDLLLPEDYLDWNAVKTVFHVRTDCILESKRMQKKGRRYLP